MHKDTSNLRHSWLFWFTLIIGILGLFGMIAVGAGVI